MSTYEMIIDKKNLQHGEAEKDAQLAPWMDGLVELHFEWTEVEAVFRNLELEKSTLMEIIIFLSHLFFFQRRALCMSTI